jgi:hypothetical protein
LALHVLALLAEETDFAVQTFDNFLETLDLLLVSAGFLFASCMGFLVWLMVTLFVVFDLPVFIVEHLLDLVDHIFQALFLGGL